MVRHHNGILQNLDEGAHTISVIPFNETETPGAATTRTFTVDAVTGPGILFSPREVIGTSQLKIYLEDVSKLMSAHIELVCTGGVFQSFTKNTGAAGGGQFIVYTKGENTARFVIDIAFMGLVAGVSGRIEVGSVIVKTSANGTVTADGAASKFRDTQNRDITPNGMDTVSTIPNIPDLTISGKVTGADGVTVTLSGDKTGSMTVNDGDAYSFSVTYGGSYTVTPTKSGVQFAPASKTFTNMSQDSTQEFAGVAPWEKDGVKYVSIPGGSFSMGQSGFAEPVHSVTLSAFEMSVYEITQGQYKSVMGSNPSNFTGDDNMPVEQVNWWDAIWYCNALSVKAGLDKCYNESTGACDFSKNGFRLPTEAEWEYACRAGTTTKFNLGDSESDLDRVGWYDSNSSNRTHPVGQKTANAWGLYDMHGNVHEWCNDWYGSYTSGNQTNPTGALSDSYGVLRGGSWRGSDGNCFSTMRIYNTPYLRTDTLGFRVVRRAQ